MPTIREIAEDPRKALSALEKELGAEPGALLQEMGDLAKQAGDWSLHVPYAAAESYFSDEAIRQEYATHVDSCPYCKQLIETIHPSDPAEPKSFGVKAAEPYREQKRKKPALLYRPALALPLAIVASSVLSVIVLLQWQKHEGLPVMLRANSSSSTFMRTFTLDPDFLSQLENGHTPGDRFRAARVYFDVTQPQIAYQQIGEGLKLGGIRGSDAIKIQTAANVPMNDPAPALEHAAELLAALRNAPTHDPAHYLELAQAEAKLGMHAEAIRSIRKYLEAEDTDPRLVAEFSELTSKKPESAVASIKVSDEASSSPH